MLLMSIIVQENEPPDLLEPIRQFCTLSASVFLSQTLISANANTQWKIYSSMAQTSKLHLDSKTYEFKYEHHDGLEHVLFPFSQYTRDPLRYDIHLTCISFVLFDLSGFNLKKKAAM